jgi:predicted amino acid dehydrogenase
LVGTRVVDKLIREMNPNGALEALEEEVQRLTDGHVPIHDLVVTKSMRATYKNDVVYSLSSPPEVVVEPSLLSDPSSFSSPPLPVSVTVVVPSSLVT